MFAKFFARGRGGGRGPVEYLLYENGQPRPEATLLRGEPEQIRKLIDECEYAQRYTSAVLSFAEADISDALKTQCMDELEQTLLPGLDVDQYSTLWVEHNDKGRTELHCVIPNVELLSGKRLQPFYSGADLPRVNAWKSAINAEHGLADPEDPRRRQSLTIPSNLPRNRSEALNEIKSALGKMVTAGQIKSRDDVVKALSHAGLEVVRQVKSSVTIRPKSGGRKFRLTGTYFQRDFSPDKLDATDAGAEYDAQRLERGRDARARWHSMIERKAEYHRQRHPRPPTPKLRIKYGKQQDRATANRHSERPRIQLKERVFRASASSKQAGRTIRLTRALAGLERCRAIARETAGDRGRDVRDPVLTSQRVRQIQDIGNRTSVYANVSDLSARDTTGWGNYAVQQRNAEAILHLQRLHRLQQTRQPVSTQSGSETELRSDGTRRGQTTRHEESNTRTYITDQPSQPGPSQPSESQPRPESQPEPERQPRFDPQHPPSEHEVPDHSVDPEGYMNAMEARFRARQLGIDVDAIDAAQSDDHTQGDDPDPDDGPGM